MDITALFNLSYGLYAVSSKDGERDVGCIANSVIQVSASPSTLAVSLNKDNYTNPCVLQAGRFTVCILSENADPNVISTFGFSSSRDKNKFESIPHSYTASGLPILQNGICGYIECGVIKTLDCFTHTIIVAEIIDANNAAKEPPMTYAYYHRVIRGKAPKNAPTYVAEAKNDSETTHTCSVCGYIYPGSDEEFKALPDSYVCPICGVAKALFS